jgi:hypothetical protein
MLGDEAGGIHDEHVVWSTAVASGGAKLVHALGVKPEEHSIIERSQPLLRGHAEQDFRYASVIASWAESMARVRGAPCTNRKAATRASAPSRTLRTPCRGIVVHDGSS